VTIELRRTLLSKTTSSGFALPNFDVTGVVDDFVDVRHSHDILLAFEFLIVSN
jgi:hypothetical protein